MPERHVIQFQDYGGEGSNAVIPIAALTDVNRSAIMGALGALRDTLTGANGILKGARVGYHTVTSVNESTVEPASFDAFSQREVKWLVKYHEDTALEETHYLELPCANLMLLDPYNSDKADMNNSDIMAFKAAFEAAASVNGNDVIVDDILFVARKS